MIDKAIHAEKRRSLLKALTYRMICTAETLLVAWIIGASIGLAVSIAGILVITKIGTYYLHERIWDHLDIFHKDVNPMWPYIAGFLDGDGWIVRSTKQRCVVGFGQKESLVLKRIQCFLHEHGIHTRWTQSRSGLGSAPINHLVVERLDDILYLCRHCLPYLIVKYDKAHAMIKFILNKKRARISEAKEKEIKKLLRRGWLKQDIAKKMDISVGPINRIGNKYFPSINWRTRSNKIRNRIKSTGQFMRTLPVLSW